MLVLINAQNQEWDPHIGVVEESLRRLGAEPVYFERYNDSHYLTYEFGATESCRVTLRNTSGDISFKPEDVIGVYWRIKPVLTTEFPGAPRDISESFRIAEWSHALTAQAHLFEAAHWVNQPARVYTLSKKGAQLRLAQKCGLQIPRTMISNDVSQIKTLGNRFIYKTLSSFMSLEQAIYTNLVDQSEILSARKSIQLAPGIYQEYVEKEFELRVTVVGEKVYTLRIDSQSQERTKVDWRYDQGEHMFSDFDLSKETQKKLLEFHRATGLSYATYDFIVNKQGEEVFLECNPSGQWFFQMEYGERISDAVAQALVSGV